MLDTSLTENKTENSKFHIYLISILRNRLQTFFFKKKEINEFFITMTNTSNKQHEIGKPKGSSAKCLLKILITGKLEPFVFGRENMWFRMRKRKMQVAIL